MRRPAPSKVPIKSPPFQAPSSGARVEAEAPMKSQVQVAIGVVLVVVMVGVFAYLIARPSPPPPAGPPIQRATPTVPASTVPTTRAGYFACLSERELDDAIKFAVAKDSASFQTLVERGRCLPLRDGVEVTVVDRVGVGAVAFVVRGEPGVRFYTITEAIAGG